MRFNPEDAVANLWPEEWYDAAIVVAEERPSKKSGNPMLDVIFRCFGGPGGAIDVHVYFVAGNAQSISRLEKLCKAVAIPFSKGEVTPEQLSGKSLKCLVKIQKDETGQFGDKNVVAAFQMAKGTQIVADGETPPPVPDDDIPF